MTPAPPSIPWRSHPPTFELPLEEHGLQWVHPDILLAHPLDDRDAVFVAPGCDRTADGLGADANRYRRWMKPLVNGWEHPMVGHGPPAWPEAPVFRAIRCFARFRPPARARCSPTAGAVRRPGGASGAAAGTSAQCGHRHDASDCRACGRLAVSQGWGGVLASAMYALRIAGGVIRLDTEVTDVEAVETLGPVFFDTGPHALARTAHALAGWIRGSTAPVSVRAGGVQGGLCALGADSLAGWRGSRRRNGASWGSSMKSRSKRACTSGRIAQRPYVPAQQSGADRGCGHWDHHMGWATATCRPTVQWTRPTPSKPSSSGAAPAFDVVLARHTMGLRTSSSTTSTMWVATSTASRYFDPAARASHCSGHPVSTPDPRGSARRAVHPEVGLWDGWPLPWQQPFRRSPCACLRVRVHLRASHRGRAFGTSHPESIRTHFVRHSIDRSTTSMPMGSTAWIAGTAGGAGELEEPLGFLAGEANGSRHLARTGPTCSARCTTMSPLRPKSRLRGRTSHAG